MKKIALAVGVFCSGLMGHAIDSYVAKVWLQEVQFNVAKDMNNNAPVSLKIVIVYDNDLYKKIGKLTAAQFFEQEASLASDNAGKFEVFNAEIVPGQKNDPLPIEPKDTTGVGIWVFGRYATPGPHRQSIGTDRIVQLNLLKKDFKVATIKP
ncbi:hypothetical protein [Candidatus Odyssella acanthamoebae]|uniref:Type VI secretion protein n=1 Tax=Candidatus Odyssella acanthamoebae TaxID=91604 RepID=A0A077ATQ1_9PROT|nr:hypothetical protein [Candidatus Paracaedibacter acanthamoebae]AIK95766.1 hypothetical protein ID47_01990 [Candidatus Paracaedibacter acanthamoebae]